MKGKTLTQLAQELERIENSREDIMVSPSVLEMNHRGNFNVNGNREAKLTSWAHQQVASYLDIPKAYYDRMFDNDKNILARNVNHWMQNKPSDERRLLRTVDGTLRGFLSSSYRVIDSYDLVSVVLPILKNKNFQIASCELTEKRLYIKAVLPSVSAAVKVGDHVQFGVIISNSEVGAGMFRIEPYLMRLACINGLITAATIKKYHVGKDIGTEEVFSVLSDEALKASNEAIMLQVRDVLLASSDPEKLFKEQVEMMRNAANTPITNFDLVEVVKKATMKVGIHSKLIRENIVAQLANGNEGAGLTQWGLVNSFTAVAKNDLITYDDSIDLERAGGSLLALDTNEWNKIAA